MLELKTSLRVLAAGQVVASIAGAIFLSGLALIVPGLPLWPLLLICATTAAGGAAGSLLAALQQQVATWLFVLSSVVGVAISLLVVGTRAGSAYLFVWPVAGAVLLLGGRAGGLVATACAVLGTGAFALEAGGILTPAQDRGVSDYVGQVSLLLALALVVVAAAVAGGNIQAALRASQERAAQLQLALGDLAAGREREAQTKTEAGLLGVELLESSTRQRSTATEAAGQVQLISSQVAELAATSGQIAAAARQVDHTAAVLRRLSIVAVKQLDQGLAESAQAVAAGREATIAARDVGKRVAETEQVLHTLQYIADETHLLSLNATIEAAGAGAAGKRFAAVASGVSKLAASAAAAVEQAQVIIGGVQSQGVAMLAAVERAETSIEHSQQASTMVAEQIGEVGQAAQQVAVAGETIAAATNQQERATRQIVEAVRGVGGVAGESASLSSQLSSIAERLGQSLARLAQGVRGVAGG